MLKQVDPPDAQLTIQRPGGARLPITDTARSLGRRLYLARDRRRGIRGKGATRADPLRARLPVSVILSRQARPEPVKSLWPPAEPPPTSALPVGTSLFDAKPETWARNVQGFCLHLKSVCIEDVHFSHDFDVLRIGKRIGHEK